MTDERQAGLRAALPRAINFRFLPPRPVDDGVWDEIAGELVAALAAQVPAQEPSTALPRERWKPSASPSNALAVPAQEERLDVERLRAALATVAPAVSPRFADVIAAEYRALGVETKEPDHD